MRKPHPHHGGKHTGPDAKPRELLPDARTPTQQVKDLEKLFKSQIRHKVKLNRDSVEHYFDAVQAAGMDPHKAGKRLKRGLK